MLHDIREIDPNFYPDRFKLPYFLRPHQFYNIVDNLNSANSNLLRFDEPFIVNEHTIRSNKHVFTFDDGLKDHLEVAKHLFKNKTKAVFFIPSGPILENSIIDSHKIQFIIAAAPPQKIIETIGLYYEDTFNLSRDNLNKFFISRWENNIWPKEMVFITRILREFDDFKWKRSLLANLFQTYVSNDPISFSKEFYLNTDDIEVILDLGHIVGGHGHFSYDLRYENVETIEYEIKKMDSFLNSFSIKEKYFAYANGGYNDNVIDELNKYNFIYSFTTGHRKVEVEDNNMFLPRIDATKTDLIK